MKIDLVEIPTATIEDFADEHGLVMQVHERAKPIGDPARYYAHFASCEVKDGGCLVGAFGNGATPDEAIRAYAQALSLKRIVIDAMRPTRREIDVPRLMRS